MSELYKKREEMRDQCFQDGRCYVNQYRGGVKEYICSTDHRPCMFQCLILKEYDPPDPNGDVHLLSQEYRIE